jgi:hypothetical protein
MTDHMPDDVSAAGRDLRAFTDELRPNYPVVRNVAGESRLCHDFGPLDLQLRTHAHCGRSGER